ncbi:DUF2017 domain-containing protein [Catellatospora coxensis]|uniref:DUF2017 domain-containing protein n=1 Tax=Catellatospora coxensis TaxID=310354 RepID=A0A8J3KX29_9ACTN|nr:DUF2017 domain-containing protein [Catellatospora coxensis]GIG08720.1 hypothetical protein Cco03nite_54200 [Catellatospora coxensis]
MTIFRRVGAECVADFREDEVRVLRKVAEEVVGLLTDGFDREDPVVERLFPDVYPEDVKNSAEFRRFTEGDLKTAKIDQAGAVLAGLPEAGKGEVRLDRESAEAWLRAINDARLALGIRLELTDDTVVEYELEEALEQDAGSARVFQLSVYSYLGYLQESLLEAIIGAEFRR